MGTLPDILIAELLIAAVSGLTFLAYSHPNAYQKIARVIMVILIVITAGICIWDISSQQTYAILASSIAPTKSHDAQYIAMAYTLPHDSIHTDLSDHQRLFGFPVVLAAFVEAERKYLAETTSRFALVRANERKTAWQTSNEPLNNSSLS